MASSLRATGRASSLARLAALLVGAWLAACVLVAPSVAAPADAFVFAAGVPPAPLGHVGRVTAFAEASSSGPSVALVKVTEENKVTTASVLGGIAGLLLGGVWIGGALFAATAYLTRKEDSDVSKALKGVASGGLEVLNFGAYVNDKYTVTDKIGSALSEAVANAKTSSDNKETIESVVSFLDSAVEAIKAADKDIGFKETFGQVVASASDLASQAVEKAVELNEEYKITDKIKEKVQELSAGTK